MNLQTTYLGLTLRNPIVVGASPFCDDIDAAMRMEEAGAAALVMHSLFEEQIDLEEAALIHHLETPAESHYEATSYFPRYDDYNLTPTGYLRTLERLKSSLTIPVIASLNGRRPGGWVDYARRLESSGADALELNTYQLATDPALSGEDPRLRQTLPLPRLARALRQAARRPRRRRPRPLQPLLPTRL
jgi:dihydroorotate dehydrogenase (fumarate)